jgi:hypothetical protein
MLSVIMLSVIMLSVIMLSVIMLSVIMLNVVAPFVSVYPVDATSNTLLDHSLLCHLTFLCFLSVNLDISPDK